MEYMNSDVACLVKYKLVPVGDKYVGAADGQVWADADISDAAYYLRRLYLDKDYSKTIAYNAERYVKDKLCVEKTADLISDRYRKILKKN